MILNSLFNLQEKMALLTVLLNITAVLVLLLLCFPAQEARTIQQGQNQNKMYNYKDKLFGAVQQREAPPMSPIFQQKRPEISL